MFSLAVTRAVGRLGCAVSLQMGSVHLHGSSTFLFSDMAETCWHVSQLTVRSWELMCPVSKSRWTKREPHGLKIPKYLQSALQAFHLRGANAGAQKGPEQLPADQRNGAKPWIGNWNVGALDLSQVWIACLGIKPGRACAGGAQLACTFSCG